MNSLVDESVDEIIKFLQLHGHRSYDRNLLVKVIPEYMRLGTFVILVNKANQIIALCSFSIIGTTALIEDLVIHKGYRYLKLIPYIVSKGWTKFPFLRFVSYKRVMKHPDWPVKVIRIQELLRRI